MFSKAKKNQNKQQMSADLVEIGDTPAGKQTSPMRASMNAQGKKSTPRPAPGVPSLISADVVIKGSVNAESEIQFDGDLEGDIRAKGLVIGEHAVVKGEVICERVKVSGRVEGAIRARHVELAASANVKGDIMHTALSIETGARFDGNCRYSDDPLSDSARSMKTEPRAPRPVVKPAETATAAAEPVEAKVELVEAAPVEEKAATAQGGSFLSRVGKADLR